MGLLFSRIYDSVYGVEARILLLGLDAAGKTTLLYKLKSNEETSTIPTMGFNVETVQSFNEVTFTMWDIGGQEHIRALWKHYHTNTDGLIFLVDSMDYHRFEEARLELESLLEADDLRGVPLMLLANKQDLPEARPSMEVAERMGVDKITGRKWRIHGCSAVSGAGIPEAMEKLSEMVKEYRKSKRSM
ncbi:ADP-ribosylation factor-like [Pseudonaja textilis]|uniref:ADP-ribosylation factor-like n=1 Tax=Pseudonaja textilis TaxID=8673 RepID=UPI000EA97C9F|nr:ADP-ribosylation factor-like [Pseudonaja textilis]